MATPTSKTGESPKRYGNPQESESDGAGDKTTKPAEGDGMPGLEKGTGDLSESLKVLRSEVNLLNFPFFALWDKDVKLRKATEFTDVEDRDGVRVKIEWLVTGDAKLGYPGPFERRVFRAIEYMISRELPPIENPVRLGSYVEIAELLDLKKDKTGGYGGHVYKRIRNAIKMIAGARVTSKGTWFQKEEPDKEGKRKRRFIEQGPFPIYARPYFAWEELPDGTIADVNYLELGSWYLESLNRRYVRPLDFHYYKSFRTNIGSRLYELLGVKFYGWNPKAGPRRFRYSTLCQLLPAVRQKHLSTAKQQLDPGHDELQKTGFLRGYRWEPTAHGEKDWLIYYLPGTRALDEISGKTFQRKDVVPEPTKEEDQPANLELFAQASVSEGYFDTQLGLLWSRVLGGLKDQLPHSTLQTLAGTRLLELKEGNATVMVPNNAVAVKAKHIYGLLVQQLAWKLNKERDEVNIRLVIEQKEEAAEPSVG